MKINVINNTSRIVRGRERKEKEPLKSTGGLRSVKMKMTIASRSQSHTESHRLPGPTESVVGKRDKITSECPQTATQVSCEKRKKKKIGSFNSKLWREGS